MLRARTPTADGLPPAPREPPGWPSPPQPTGSQRSVRRPPDRGRARATANRGTSYRRAQACGEALQRRALGPVADDQEGRIACACQRREQDIQPLLGGEPAEEGSVGADTRVEHRARGWHEMPDHADAFFADPPAQQALSHELAGHDEPSDPLLESHHETMGPEDRGVRSRLLLRREAPMNDGVHVEAGLTPTTHLTFGEHEPVRAAKPEVVDRHDNRDPALARCQQDGRAEGGVHVVDMHDVGGEAVDNLSPLPASWRASTASEPPLPGFPRARRSLRRSAPHRERSKPGRLDRGRA